jgi:hypothetical protein
MNYKFFARPTMKSSAIALSISLFVFLSACKKKEESCWECFSKPKAECQGMVKCKWEPKITMNEVWSSNSTSSYQVTDNGRCMCEQDPIPVVEKSTKPVASLPFYSFSDLSVIVADKNNNVWISHNQTTECYNGSAWTTNNITPYNNSANQIAPYSQVSTTSGGFSVSPGNILFATCQTYGLASVDANNAANSWSYYQTINTAIPTQKLTDVYAETDNRIWIGTKEYGVIKFETPNTWTAYNSSNTSLHSNSITSLDVDNAGNLWMGTEIGFAKLANGTVTEFMVGYVHDIACDNQGLVWAATDDGLKRWNTSANTMEYFGVDNSGLNTAKVLSLTVDASGKLWIGTDAGLYAWEGEKIVKYVPANEYQVGSVIKCISAAPNGKLWIATDKGVASYTPN